MDINKRKNGGRAMARRRIAAWKRRKKETEGGFKEVKASKNEKARKPLSAKKIFAKKLSSTMNEWQKRLVAMNKVITERPGRVNYDKILTDLDKIGGALRASYVTLKSSITSTPKQLSASLEDEDIKTTLANIAILSTNVDLLKETVEGLNKKRNSASEEVGGEEELPINDYLLEEGEEEPQGEGEEGGEEEPQGEGEEGGKELQGGEEEPQGEGEEEPQGEGEEEEEEEEEPQVEEESDDDNYVVEEFLNDEEELPEGDDLDDEIGELFSDMGGKESNASKKSGLGKLSATKKVNRASTVIDGKYDLSNLFNFITK